MERAARTILVTSALEEEGKSTTASNLAIALAMQQRYDEAVAYRSAGGSWGVVAHLLGLKASDVVATLAAFERNQPQGQIGSVAAVLATAGSGATANNQGHGSTDNGGTGGHNNGGGGSGGHATPTPTPSPSGAVNQLLDTVDQVLSQLPLPTPSPTRTGSPTLPLPLPVPVPSISLPALPTPLP